RAGCRHSAVRAVHRFHVVFVFSVSGSRADAAHDDNVDGGITAAIGIPVGTGHDAIIATGPDAAPGSVLGGRVAGAAASRKSGGEPALGSSADFFLAGSGDPDPSDVVGHRRAAAVRPARTVQQRSPDPDDAVG
ncbi:MAG: hypothetical protein LIQ30_07195, partial [Planctomycetes bacterium]|nr:hypothetical protein [Planctomycetota bacterium]